MPDLLAGARNHFATPGGLRQLRVIRVAFLGAILLVLLWQLRDIGWDELRTNLPGQPLFYAIFLVGYFFQPAAELMLHRMVWTFELRKALPAFIKKRVFNRDVLGYSGEVYLFAWAQRVLTETKRQIGETIRDMNILSSLASTLVAVTLLLVFLSVGRLSIVRLLGDHWVWYLSAGLLVLVVLLLLGSRFRHLVFSMQRKKAVEIFLLQIVRFVIGRALQIAMWIVVMPEVPLAVWFTYAAGSILLSRIPLLPNQSLLFVGMGIEMSSMMDVPAAPIAGMLLVTSVLEKVLNATLFGLISASDTRLPPTPS